MPMPLHAFMALGSAAARILPLDQFMSMGGQAVDAVAEQFTPQPMQPPLPEPLEPDPFMGYAQGPQRQETIGDPDYFKKQGLTHPWPRHFDARGYAEPDDELTKAAQAERQNRQKLEFWLHELPTIEPAENDAHLQQQIAAQEAWLRANPVPSEYINSMPDEAARNQLKYEIGQRIGGTRKVKDGFWKSAGKEFLAESTQLVGDIAAGTIRSGAEDDPDYRHYKAARKYWENQRAGRDPWTGLENFRAWIERNAEERQTWERIAAEVQHDPRSGDEKLADWFSRTGREKAEELRPVPATPVAALGAKIGAITPGIGIGAAGTAAGGPAGAAIAFMGTTYGPTYENIYQTLKAEGMNEDEARNRASGTAAITTIVAGAQAMLLPGGDQASKMAVRDILQKTILEGGAKSGASFAAANAINSLIATKGLGRPIDEHAVEEALTSSVKGFAEGFAIHSAMSLPAAVKAWVAPSFEQRQIGRPDANPEGMIRRQPIEPQPAPAQAPAPDSRFVALPLDQMPLPQLRGIATELGIDPKGLRKPLIERIREAQTAPTPQTETRGGGSPIPETGREALPAAPSDTLPEPARTPEPLREPAREPARSTEPPLPPATEPPTSPPPAPSRAGEAGERPLIDSEKPPIAPEPARAYPPAHEERPIQVRPEIRPQAEGQGHDQGQGELSPPAQAQEQTPAPRSAAPRYGPENWANHASIERTIVDAYRSTDPLTSYQGGYRELTDAAKAGDPLTFYRELPAEIKHFLQDKSLPVSVKTAFKVSPNRNEAGGADAFGELGDRYFEIVKREYGGTLPDALEHARRSDDPTLRFMAEVYDRLPMAEHREPSRMVPPEKVPTGSEFEYLGYKFRIETNEDGVRILKDGDDFTEVPADWLQRIPMDLGTLRKPGAAAPDAPADAPPGGAWAKLKEWSKRTKAEAAQRMLQEAREGRAPLRSGFTPEDAKLAAAFVIDLADYVAQGVKWSAKTAAALVREIPELARYSTGQLFKMFNQARRLHRMDEQQRAEWIVSQLQAEGGEPTKQTVRRLTGQIDTPKIIGELAALQVKLRAAAKGSREGYRLARQEAAAQAQTLAERQAQQAHDQDARNLKTKLRAEAKGSREGYQTGRREMAGLQAELTRIIRDNLPAPLHGEFLRDVARADSLLKLRTATRKASELLADYDLRQALDQVETLTGKLPLPLHTAANKPILGPQNRPPTGADAVPMRKVDLNTLAEPMRSEVAKLKAKARTLKLAMEELNAKGGSVEDKYALVDQFNQINQDIRQHVADHLALRETRVGQKNVLRETVVADMLKRIDPRGEAAADVSVTPKAAENRGKLRRLRDKTVTSSLNMRTLASRILGGADNDAFRIAIDQVIEAQERFYSGRRQFHDAIAAGLDAAGIRAGSKRLLRWMRDTETVDLQSGQRAELTRQHMVDLVANADDPQTAALIERGVPFTFRSNARANPYRITLADIDAMAKRLTPAERALVDIFKNYNERTLTQPAMAAKLDITGTAPTPHARYFMRARNRKQLADAALPEGWRGHRQRALENISSMKERAADITTPLYIGDFLPDIFKYADDTLKLIHLAEPVRNAAMVWEDPRIAQALERFHGPEMNQRVAQFLEDTMMVEMQPPPDWGSRATQFLSRQVSRAWLQANPSPVAKNVIGGTLSLMPAFDIRDLAPAVARAFRPETFREMTSRSGFAWDRYHGGLYGQYSPMTGGHEMAVAQLGLLEAIKAGKPGAAIDALPFMAWADSVPLRVAWEASKNWAKRTGANDAAQLARFHEAVFRTQNGTGSTEISGLASSARRNPMLQPFLMFKSDLNKKLNLLMDWKRLGTADRAKVVASVALSALASSLVGYGIKRGGYELGVALGGDRDPEKEGKMLAQAGWETASSLAQSTPGLGYFGDALIDFVRSSTDAQQFEFSNPPLEALNQFGQSLSQLIYRTHHESQRKQTPAEVERQRQAMIKSIERAVTTAFPLTGTPAVPLWKIWRNIYDSAMHQEKPKRPSHARS